jgi:hypothetical protein
MKTCTKCGAEKPATSEYFPKQSSGKNGLGARCKPCHAEKQREWNKNHAEASRAISKRYSEKNRGAKGKYNKAYYENNKEAIKKQGKQYREANKEAITRYNKQHYKDNPEYYKRYQEVNKEAIRHYYKVNAESIAIKGKQYRDSNPEARSENSRRWYKNNPDKARTHWQARRARKHELPSTLTAAQWGMIQRHFKNTCAYCGEEKTLTQEHFVPLSKGGEYTHNNILPACQCCNKSKGAKGFGQWYPTFKHYSKHRERKILKFLNYQTGIQQLALL